MNKKVLFIIVVLFCYQFIISCCRNPREFIDFTEIELIVEQEAAITNDSLSILVNATDYRVVAGVFGDLGFNETMALSCEEGLRGLKFPVQSVEITSNQDFDAQHLAGMPLNDLFMQSALDGNPSEETFQMIEPEGFMDFGYAELKLFTAPTLSKVHQFSLTFSKSDETIITASTGQIEWE